MTTKQNLYLDRGNVDPFGDFDAQLNNATAGPNSDLKFHSRGLGHLDEIIEAPLDDFAFDSPMPFNPPSSSEDPTSKKVTGPPIRVQNDVNDTLEMVPPYLPDMPGEDIQDQG